MSTSSRPVALATGDARPDARDRPLTLTPAAVVAALGDFTTDLDEARATFGHDQREGVALAVDAAARLAGVLDPERERGHVALLGALLGGLADLEAGRDPPPFLRGQKPTAQKRAKDNVKSWMLKATIAVFVSRLLETKAWRKDKVLKEVVAVLQGAAFPVKSAEQVNSWRRFCSEGRGVPEAAYDFYMREITGPDAVPVISDCTRDEACHDLLRLLKEYLRVQGYEGGRCTRKS